MDLGHVPSMMGHSLIRILLVSLPLQVASSFMMLRLGVAQSPLTPQAWTEDQSSLQLLPPQGKEIQFKFYWGQQLPFNVAVRQVIIDKFVSWY